MVVPWHRCETFVFKSVDVLFCGYITKNVTDLALAVH